MNVKKIGMTVGGSIGSFAVIIAAMYFLYPHINPDKKKEIETAEFKMHKMRYDPENYGTQAVDSLRIQLSKMQYTIDSLKVLEANHLAQIDSLKELSVQEQQAQQEAEEKAKEIEQVTVKKLEDVSRSLLNLDEDSLAPIVNLLEDQQLVGLYSSASNMQRAKLLRSLKPDKAATILKKVM